MNYKTRLQELRINKNMSQKELAQELNIARQTYNHYEVQENVIPLKHLNSLANYFNVSIDYLLNLTNISSYKSNNNINKLTSAKRLKEFRKENNLTLEKLGNILNCSYGTIAGYELGRYLIATPFLYTICSKYHISADYLLGKIDKPKYLK